MKIGIIGWFNEDDFLHASQRGIDSLEFDINNNDDIPAFLAAAPKINRWISTYGVDVSAVGQWGTTRIMPDGSINEAQLSLEKQLIDGADAVGCHVYITGVNYIDSFSFEENCAFAIAYLRQLVEYGKPRGVKVCLYNCAYNAFTVCDPAWDIILGAVDGLGIKYDPSHAIINGRDYKAEMAKWAKRIFHVHLKGTLNLKTEWDFPPAGLDETDWRAVLGILYSADYDGCLSIEPHSAYWNGEKSERGTMLTVRYFRSLLI